MSDLDARPEERLCEPAGPAGPAAMLLPEREVPLGGLRATVVRRTLPHRRLPTVGAWCFLDHFGPDGQPMRVLPHPHIGLQTVTWPFAGEIRHRDSLGNDLIVRPGELNLMTGGRGVAHSEFSVDTGTALHGLQLWVALPDDVRGGEARFENHRNLPVVERPGVRATVLIGDFEGARSPAIVHSPLLGVDAALGGGRVDWELNPAFEHAVLVIDGDVSVAGERLAPGPLLYLGSGRSGITVEARGAARLILLGGAPFEEEIVMWWNFVARSHAEIVAARTDWENADLRYGNVSGHDGKRIPAPPIPNARLTPRRRR